MRPRTKSFICKDELKSSNLSEHIKVFNSRLTKKLSTCRLSVVKCTDFDTCLQGGVKVHFNFAKSAILQGEIVLNKDRKEEFVTEFKFSKKAKYVVPLSSQNTGNI